MQDRTHAGKAFRIRNSIEAYTRECLLGKAARSFTNTAVIPTQFVRYWVACLTDLFCAWSVPVHIRSDNGSEFSAAILREWLNRLTVKPFIIEPGSPWENGYSESMNGEMRDELLNKESFYSL